MLQGNNEVVEYNPQNQLMMQSSPYNNYNYNSVSSFGSNVGTFWGGTAMDELTRSIIKESEKKFLQYIVRLHAVLSGNEIDVLSVTNLLDALAELKKHSEFSYMETLMYPESSRGSKIPARVPIPSSSFQLKQSYPVRTNSLGNASIIINPFFLTGDATKSTVFINNHDSFDGTASNDHFYPVQIGQNIPAVYNQYRLVSASIIIKYVGRLDIMQGLVGGAIIFDSNISPQTVSTTVSNANLAKYGDFNLAQDSFFQQENFAIEGVRELYFPIDPTWEQYQKLGTSKDGYGMLFYIQGTPPSSSCFKLEVTFNMECLPDATFLNYIPTSLPEAVRDDVKQSSIMEVQKAPITKPSEARKQRKGASFWDNVIAGIGKALPLMKDVATFVSKII